MKDENRWHVFHHGTRWTLSLKEELADIEAVFLFPWASIFRQLGWAGLIEMTAFILILAVTLVYAWKKGALEWEK